MKSHYIKVSILVFIILVVFPISLAWWIFFPLAIVSVFLLKQVYPTIIAGFILDVFYFGGQYEYILTTLPIFLSASLVVSVVFILLESKFRYNV